MSQTKPRVFGIGLSRTGTQSLTHALETLGYKARHWPSHMWDIHIHEACTDISVSARFEFLDKLYPGSKFIYTVRDMDSWLESCREHWKTRRARKLTGADDDGYVVTAWEYEYLLYGTWEFNADLWRAAYERFDARVKAHFKDRPADLLGFNITGGEGWAKLLPFLGFKEVPFPKRNPRKTTNGA